MYRLLIGFIVLIGSLIESIVFLCTGTVSSIIIWMTILLGLVFVLIDEYNFSEDNIKFLLVLNIILRFGIMLWNVYGRGVFTLPGIGTDTEGFYEAAFNISRDLSLLDSKIYGGIYSKYLGLVFSLTGPSYLFGSFLNFLYGIAELHLMQKTILTQFEDASEQGKKYADIAVLLFAFEPTNMILCSSLRRESLIILFVIWSAKLILEWINDQKNYKWIAAVAFVLLASIIHAGIAGILIGYAVLIIFYNPKDHSWSIKRDSFLTVLLIAGILVICLKYKNVFLSKILFEDQNELYKRMGRAAGGAAYLKGLRITSFGSFVKYIPIKFVYFLFSPMPWNWRGLNDAIAFILDSCFYIILLIPCIKCMVRYNKNPQVACFGISFLSSAIIFAVGCSNAANAMRHRLKLLSILILLYCFFKSLENASETETECGRIDDV